MELIRISDCKLKIMLTPTDMRHFELNADTFGEDTVQMHRAFRLLLDEIRKQTDFEADDNRISVQYFPSREGGCEMFISNLPPPSYEPEQTALCCPIQQGLQLQKISRGKSFYKECAYGFESLSSLIGVCARLYGADYIESSNAFFDSAGRYYLILTVMTVSPFIIPKELNFIVEYGSIENATVLRLYLREYGETICKEDAIGHLGALS